MLGLCLLISAAVSADAFLIGASYGMKNVEIPFSSKLITGFCACFCGFAAAFAKETAAFFITEAAQKCISTCALGLIGGYFLAKAIFTNIRPGEKISLTDFTVKSLGLKISVVRDMSECDIDDSGVIDKKEALLLGLALSGDIAAVGLFAFPGGGALLFSVMTGVFCVLCLGMGNLAGKIPKLKNRNFRKIADFALPAVIFLSLISNMIFG